MKRKLSCISIIMMMLITALAPFGTVSYADDSSDTVLFASDFEDGNINNWSAFGGAGKLSLFSKAAHSGENSLKVTERERTFQGPSVKADSLFKPNNTYNFSSWVYQNSDSVKTIMWTMRYTDSLGVAHFANISEADVEPDKWVELSGSLEIPDDSLDYLLYFECSNATIDFCIDDVKITGEAINDTDISANQTDSLYSFDFEGGTELWGPRGEHGLIRTDEYSNTGSHSIYTTNRNQIWNGPAVDIDDIKRGVSYFYSAYIMYNGKEYENSHNFLIEVQYNINGETIYQQISEKTLKKNYWTRIVGTYTLPENATDVAFYIQTANIENEEEADINDLMSFYTDTVSITETSIVHRKTAVISLFILIACIIAALILHFLINAIIKKTEKKKAAIKAIFRDAMTQALNRNAYEKKIEALSSEPELCKSLYFALCDVNFLKYINDNHGHEKGDEAITRCAKMLMDTVGNLGEVYRTGGDEFVCISTEPMQTQIIEAIEKESANDMGYPFAVASGFAEYDPETDTDSPDIKAIIERCDQEMYTNKQEIKSKNKNYSRK